MGPTTEQRELEARRAAARRTALVLGLIAAGFFVSAFLFLPR